MQSHRAFALHLLLPRLSCCHPQRGSAVALALFVVILKEDLLLLLLFLLSFPKGIRVLGRHSVTLPPCRLARRFVPKSQSLLKDSPKIVISTGAAQSYRATERRNPRISPLLPFPRELDPQFLNRFSDSAGAPLILIFPRFTLLRIAARDKFKSEIARISTRATRSATYDLNRTS